MENHNEQNQLSPDEVHRRALAKGLLTSILPRSRGQSPARQNAAYGNPDSLPGSADASPRPVHRDLGSRTRSDSPIITEGGEVTIPGEDEFNLMVNSVRSNQASGANEHSLVAAFSKISKVSDPPTLTAQSTEYNPTLDSAARQSERADDTLSNIDRPRARQGKDFILLFSKPIVETKTQSQEPQRIDNSNEERGIDSGRAMGRRRRTRTPGTRTRRQQPGNSQRTEEGNSTVTNVTLGIAKPYLPSYIQPMADVSRPTALSYVNDYNGPLQRRNSSQGQSATINSLGDVPSRRPAKKGFVKRHRARPGDNRLSSSSSGDSSDEGDDKTPKRTSNDNLRHDTTGHESGPYPSQRPRTRTRQRRPRQSQQVVVSHTPDYIRTRKISQPAVSSAKQSDFSDHLNGRNTNSRKQYLAEEVNKYSTLPDNFRQSLGQGSSELARSTTSDQSKPYVPKQTSKLLDDINQNVLPNRHELIIGAEQTSVSLDGTRKARNVAHQSNPNQSQTKHSPSSAVLHSNKTSGKVDLHGAASGRKGSIDKAAVQLPQNKPTIDDLRNLFNSTDGAPKTDFGQVYSQSSSKKQSPRTSSSSRKSSVSEQTHLDVAEIVYRPRMIEARKVGEDYWPRDEDTEKLLNKNYVTPKTPGEDVVQGQALSNHIPNTENTNSMNNGGGVVSGNDFPVDVVRSPKETNLNDGGANYFSVPVNVESVNTSSPVNHTDSTQANEQTNVKPKDNNKPEHINQLSESDKSFAWNFEETDAKLKEFNVLDLKNKGTPTSQITEQVLKDITESLHDISIGGKPVYKAPTFDMSVPVGEIYQEENAEANAVHAAKMTSSRKSSVVSQSTALPRKSTSQAPTTKIDVADIDEGCFTEEDTSRPSLLDQPTALLSSVNGLTNGVDGALRRRRKYSAGTQGTSDTTSISTGADSSRSLSDPMPHGEIPIQESGKNIMEIIESKKDHTLDNSVSDLSIFSENMSVQDEFGEDIGDSNLDKSDFKKPHAGKTGAKVVKKKSFSDPIKNAVETAGKMGKVQSPVQESALYTSSSEPNLSEQMDDLGDLNGFKMLHGHGSQMDMMHHRRVSPTTMTIQGDLKSSDLPDPPQSDSSNRSSMAEKSDGIEHVVEHEEKQFQQLFDSMTVSSPNESDMKMPVAHTRSCSEPVDMDNNLIKSSSRVRRPGIIQAPSMGDMTLSNLNSMNAKQFSSSVGEIHSATLPRAAGSRGLEYPDMRKHVVKNLLDTEGSYVKSLKILFETYLNPLKRPENHSICEPRHVDIIFFQIPEILQHHQRFYANVRDRYQNWDPKYVKMGDVFIQSFNKDKLFESYTSYIDNYTNARETVNYVTQAKSSFRAFLEQCQRENKEKQRLSDLMIKPVQRIPRYELILKDLVKHTPDDHPDRPSLLVAQQEMHALSVQMNKGEKEAEAADKHDRVLREIEQLVEGVIEIAGVPKRRFILQEILVELKSGNKKDRCLWLFNDLLMCTQVKKRAGSMRRTSMNMWAAGGDRAMIDFTSKYKFLWKFPLEDVELLKGSTSTSRQCAERQLQHLHKDQEILINMEKLSGELSSNHVNLDDAIREMLFHNNQRIVEKQHAASQGLSIPGRMEIGISTPEGMKTFPFEFATDDRKTRFEEFLINARTNTTSQKGRWDPAFLKAIPVSKNRNGMQLSCSAANSDSYTGSKEVWVCNTDDYVGEICFLNVIEGDPCQSHCVRVCKSKICCLTQAPAWDRRFLSTTTFLNEFSKAPLGHNPTRRRSSSNSNPAHHIMSWDTDESDEDNTSPFSTRSSCGKSPYGTNNSTISNYGDGYLPSTQNGNWYLGSSSDDDIQIPVVSPLLPSPYLRRHFGFDHCTSSMPHLELSTSTDTTIMSEPSTGSRAATNPLMPNLLGSGAFKKDNDGSTLHGSLEDLLSDNSTNTISAVNAGVNLAEAGRALGGLGSMWMGTEDGTINVYSTSESHGDPKSVAQLHHNASVQCILYHEGQMFVALSNGDLVIYVRNMTTGHWNFENKKTVSLGSPPNQVTKMIVVGEKDLWCGCQNQVVIIDMKTHNLKSFFAVSQDCKRQIYCMVCCGFGVWVALDRRAQIKLYHTVTHDLITDIDVTQPVAKMLASSDAIIRQHKAACLRITSLLVCNDLLWVGTSAGVVLTMALPSITGSTNSLPLPIIPQGLSYGHTGHARFLMAIKVAEKEMTPPPRGYRRPSLPKRRSSSTSNNNQVRTSTLVISGGDGYEDFRMNSASEAAGNGDSTNHMLVWKV